MSAAPKCSFCDRPSISTMGMAGPGAGSLQEIHCCGSDECLERERDAREAFDCDAQEQEGATHPAALAFHAINNAVQIARGLVTYPNDVDSMPEDGARIAELLMDAGRHVGEIYVLLGARGRTIVTHKELIASLREEVLLRERIPSEHDAEFKADIKLRDELIAALEDDKRELLEDGMRQAQTIALLEATNTDHATRLGAVQKQKEDLVRDLAGALAEITDLFNRAQGIVVYDRTPARPRDTIIHEAPRKAAAGS